MTDDISKVVPPVHAVTFVPSFSEAARQLGMAQAQGNRPAIAHWQGIVDAHEAAAKAALRLESATTPAEAGKGAEVLQMVLDGLITGRISEWPQLRPAIASVLEANATLARQLAEAKAESDQWERDYNALSVRMLQLTGHAAAAAGSALAAATRRVAEVEGLVGKWRELGGNDSLDVYYADGLRACADELEQLTKEPTK